MKLIEPLWNVKKFAITIPPVSSAELIEPLWNVKVLGGGISKIGGGINRTIMECKGYSVTPARGSDS